MSVNDFCAGVLYKLFYLPAKARKRGQTFFAAAPSSGKRSKMEPNKKILGNL